MPQFNKLVYKIYDAALSPEHWSAALDEVATLSGSNGAIIYAKKPEGWTFPLHSDGVSDALKAYVDEGWAEHNPWLESRMESGFRVGDVYRDLDIVTPEEMETNPFYTDFLRRFGLGRQMVAIIYSDLGNPTCLVSHRQMSRGPFQKNEMDQHLLVARHLEQSLRITCKVTQMNAQYSSVSNAFDMMDRAAFILDKNQTPIKINQSARNLLDSYFIQSNNQIKPVLPHEETTFSQVIKQAHNLVPENRTTLQPTTISDKQGKDRLVVWGVPLIGNSADKLGLVKDEKNVLVLAQPLQQDNRIEPTVIRSVFGLTTGEARLASLLGAGRSVAEAAKELNLTEGTTRFVLKRIFRKMDVHRQAELVMKIRQLNL
ncbi:MAG: helix-turn-helix transcriptional regulator [Xanthobacter sp.]